MHFKWVSGSRWHISVIHHTPFSLRTNSCTWVWRLCFAHYSSSIIAHSRLPSKDIQSKVCYQDSRRRLLAESGLVLLLCITFFGLHISPCFINQPSHIHPLLLHLTKVRFSDMSRMNKWLIFASARGKWGFLHYTPHCAFRTVCISLSVYANKGS
jgi:hypothetical protein